MAYQIRQLTLEETATATQWARQEGWKPGHLDMKAFLAQDPEGFLGGFFDGELVSMISAVRYEGNFGFVGFYIVKSDQRGKGLGYQIWQEGIKRLEGCNMGLDGVMAQIPNYEKSGFVFAHQNRRYVGLAKEKGTTDPSIVDALEVDFEVLNAFDRRHFPAPRPAFLKSWLTLPQRTSFAAVKESRVLGYGTARPCDDGIRIGPLFAENPEVASQLFNAFQNQYAGERVYIDVSLRNEHAVKMVEHDGFEGVFETARMYTEGEPDINHAGVYGITSFELG